jgi:hypothetical protein
MMPAPFRPCAADRNVVSTFEECLDGRLRKNGTILSRRESQLAKHDHAELRQAPFGNLIVPVGVSTQCEPDYLGTPPVLLSRPPHLAPESLKVLADLRLRVIEVNELGFDDGRRRVVDLGEHHDVVLPRLGVRIVGVRERKGLGEKAEEFSV